MKMNEFLLAELERTIEPTRRVLERVPEGKNDWKPHEKSMPLGYLAALCAMMPAWIAMIVGNDETDIAPPGGSPYRPTAPATRAELLQLLDDSAAAGRKALQGADDEHLAKPWRMLVAGRQVSEEIRHVAISDAVLSHLAHHRGQLTVYLRLNEVAVPSVYGPTADEPM